MTRGKAAVVGALTGTALSMGLIILSVKTVAPILGEGLWPDLMGAVVIVCALAGAVFAAYPVAYKDRVAEVTGYCRPLREKVR